MSDKEKNLFLILGVLMAVFFIVSKMEEKSTIANQDVTMESRVR